MTARSTPSLLGLLSQLLRRLFALPFVDETEWHKCSRIPLFVTLEGRNPTGQRWRRKRDGKWEYRQDEETLDDFLDRQY